MDKKKIFEFIFKRRMKKCVQEKDRKKNNLIVHK